MGHAHELNLRVSWHQTIFLPAFLGTDPVKMEHPPPLSLLQTRARLLAATPRPHRWLDQTPWRWLRTDDIEGQSPSEFDGGFIHDDLRIEHPRPRRFVCFRPTSSSDQDLATVSWSRDLTTCDPVDALCDTDGWELVQVAYKLAKPLSLSVANIQIWVRWDNGCLMLKSYKHREDDCWIRGRWFRSPQPVTPEDITHAPVKYGESWHQTDHEIWQWTTPGAPRSHQPGRPYIYQMAKTGARSQKTHAPWTITFEPTRLEALSWSDMVNVTWAPDSGRDVDQDSDFWTWFDAHQGEMSPACRQAWLEWGMRSSMETS